METTWRRLAIAKPLQLLTSCRRIYLTRRVCGQTWQLRRAQFSTPPTARRNREQTQAGEDCESESYPFANTSRVSQRPPKAEDLRARAASPSYPARLAPALSPLQRRLPGALLVAAGEAQGNVQPHALPETGLLQHNLQCTRWLIAHALFISACAYEVLGQGSAFQEFNCG